MNTKRDVVRHCREFFKANPGIFENDAPARREYFVNFVDMLARSGQITEKQAYSWSNPF